jgi:hypothetical protein
LPPGVHPDAVERAPTSTEPFAVLSLVLGIISIFSSWCCLGMLAAPAGLVIGAIAVGRSPRGSRGVAIAGLVTSAAGLAIWLVLQLVGLAMTFGSMHRSTP